MTLLAYLSYIISETFGMSPIMTIFVCGVLMSHYTYHNMSEEGRKSSSIAINTLGHATEAYLFIYLGLSIYTIDQETFNLPFIIYIMLGSTISRGLSVALPIGIYACVKKCKITLNLK